MIQVNLIPDLKAEFLKAQRTKRVVISVASLIGAAFLAVVVIMFIYVNVAQKEHSNNLSEDISRLVDEYQAIEDIDKIVTIQKQLESLPGLHQDKPLISRVVKYLSVITPKNIEFRTFDISFETEQIIISGSADRVSDVNRFANSIKNAVYTIGDDRETVLTPFSAVVLNTITSDSDGAQYDIQFAFDTEIFNNHEAISLTVPTINSTTSEIEAPTATEPREGGLFDDMEVVQ